MVSRRAEPSLALPLGGSAILHAAVLTMLVVFRPSAPRVLPPVYRVTLIAAPVGAVSAGTVQPVPRALAPTPPPRTKARPAQKAMPLPTKKAAAPKATAPPATPPSPTQTKTAPKPGVQAAAGSAEGGRGADVANVNTAGIEFPFPTYLENIVRAIKLQFKWQGRGDLRADVVFLIHRDGSVSNLRLQTSSGVYTFNTSALGAVEAAGNAHAFGPLPSAFPDDVLPVIFSFDPRFIR